jgi:protein SOK2
MTSHTVTPHGYVSGAAQSQQNAVHDPTGQTCPPGAKPRVTATLWEDEGSLCYQVEAKGVCVARREGECDPRLEVRAKLTFCR